MKDYWLATLISSVEEVDSRKRLQKAIYLLQSRKGFPLKFDYVLHYYGPYSFELANLIDQLDGAKIIEESPEETGFGSVRYKSQATLRGKEILADFQQSKTGKEAYRQIRPFIPQFVELNQKDLRLLELAATVAYYYKGNWVAAKVQTESFKRISKDDEQLQKAVELAKEFKSAR